MAKGKSSFKPDFANPNLAEAFGITPGRAEELHSGLKKVVVARKMRPSEFAVGVMAAIDGVAKNEQERGFVFSLAIIALEKSVEVGTLIKVNGLIESIIAKEMVGCSCGKCGPGEEKAAPSTPVAGQSS